MFNKRGFWDYNILNDNWDYILYTVTIYLFLYPKICGHQDQKTLILTLYLIDQYVLIICIAMRIRMHSSLLTVSFKNRNCMKFSIKPLNNTIINEDSSFICIPYSALSNQVSCQYLLKPNRVDRNHLTTSHMTIQYIK